MYTFFGTQNVPSVYIRLTETVQVFKKVAMFTFISKINKAQLISISNIQVCLKSVYMDKFQGSNKVFYLKVQLHYCSNGFFCTSVWQLTFNEWLSGLPLVVITICSLLTAIHCWMCLYWFVLQTSLHTFSRVFSSICAFLFKNLFHLLMLILPLKILASKSSGTRMPLWSEWF